MSSACPHKIWQNQSDSVPVPSEEIIFPKLSPNSKTESPGKNQYCEILQVTENQSGKTSENDGKISIKNLNVKQFPGSFAFNQVRRKQIERNEWLTVHILDNLPKQRNNCLSYYNDKDIIYMHDNYFKSGKCNFEGCKISLYSHLNIDYFRFMLSDYHDKQLCQFLEFGFPTEYFGKAQQNRNTPDIVINHKAAKDFPVQMQNYLKKRKIPWRYIWSIYM